MRLRLLVVVSCVVVLLLVGVLDIRLLLVRCRIGLKVEVSGVSCG